ncbi:MAG: hypothetical protein E7307_02065 [Butyrivibrio sp.]|nr:hypothetical protein [Butyrivibrio sp.]
MKIMKLLFNKLRSKRGETLTETLSSLLIIVPAMVMLAGAIVAAARINYQARNMKASELPAYIPTTQVSGTISGAGEVSFSGGAISWCNEDGSVYYYFR